MLCIRAASNCFLTDIAAGVYDSSWLFPNVQASLRTFNMLHVFQPSQSILLGNYAACIEQAVLRLSD